MGMSWSHRKKSATGLLAFVGVLILLTSPLSPLCLVPAGTAPETDPNSAAKPLTRLLSTLTPRQGEIFPSSTPKVVLYHSGPALPASWTKAEGSLPALEQRPLAGADPETVQREADLFCVTPADLAWIRSWTELVPLPEEEWWPGIHVVFSGQAHDPDNRETRAFRWTSWLFVHKAGNPPGKTWWNHDQALWPDEPDVLAGLRLKEQGHSANSPAPRRAEAWAEIRDGILPRTNSDWSACWTAVQSGHAALTFLPACVKLAPGGSQPDATFWSAPEKGTLIQLEVLALSARSSRTNDARKWAERLLSPDLQNRLLTETGYFPTTSDPAKEIAHCPLRLPPGDWFNRGEFILENQLETRPVPPPASPTE